MTRFFQGWRRRLGMATLIMACLLMIPWLRTFGNWPVGQGYEFRVEFLSEGILLTANRAEHSPPEVETDDAGNVVSRGTSTFFDELMKMTIPYWVVVAPPTLLSAWLLLRNPRAKNPVNSQLPSRNEV